MLKQGWIARSGLQCHNDLLNRQTCFPQPLTLLEQRSKQQPPPTCVCAETTPPSANHLRRHPPTRRRPPARRPCRESNVVSNLLNRRYAVLHTSVFSTYRRETGASLSPSL